MSYLDLKKTGSLVVSAPPKVIGMFTDFFQRTMTDVGAAGPDRGEIDAVVPAKDGDRVHARERRLAVAELEDVPDEVEVLLHGVQVSGRQRHACSRAARHGRLRFGGGGGPES